MIAESKSYLDYVLDYFLVLTALCTIFICCACSLYAVYMGGMKHVFRFVSLNLVFCIVVTNVAGIPRLLLTNDQLKCEVAAIVDHYFWIAQNCWLCSLAFESFKNMPLISPSVDFRRRAILHAILCYVSPTVLLSVTAVAHYSQSYWLGFLYGSRFCSLSNVGLFIFASILPTALTLVLSIFFLLVAIYRFQPAKQADAQLRNTTFSLEIEKTRKWLITSLMFIFVAGICWCIHLFYSVLRVTLAFYFSVFLDQLRTTLVSLLFMYNVRAERSLDRKIFWEKVRINTSSRMSSMHSFHSTPIRKIPQSQDFSGQTAKLQSQFYNSNCKSMYEFGAYHTAPRSNQYQISPSSKPPGGQDQMNTLNPQNRSSATRHLNTAYNGGANNYNSNTATSNHQQNQNFNYSETATLVKPSNTSRNLNRTDPNRIGSKHRSETSPMLLDIAKFSTTRANKNNRDANSSAIATISSANTNEIRKINYVELPPLCS